MGVCHRGGGKLPNPQATGAATVSSSGGRGALPEVVVAPAGGCAVALLRARVKGAGADRGDRAGRRGGLPDVVESPAGNGAVALDRTRVIETGADRGDRAGR